MTMPPFKRFPQPDSQSTGPVTSSPESADGPTPCDSPGGPTTAPSGREVVPASRSVRQPEDVVNGRRATSIYGLYGGPSSLNAHLVLCLANRLPTPGIGLMSSAMTWNQWATKSGRRFCRLAVSVSTMSAIGCSLLATPTVAANQDAPSMQKHLGCRGIVVSPSQWQMRMGYPAAWGCCGATAMQSCHKSRQSSSKRTRKP